MTPFTIFTKKYYLKNITQFIIPLAFLVMCGVSVHAVQLLEAALYFFMGAGFSIINLLKANMITTHLGFWNKLAWGMVVLAGLMFVAVLLNDANQEILGR